MFAMNSNTMQPSWEQIACMPDEDIPLLQGCLLIALDEYPDLDINSYRAELDRHVAELAPRVSSQEADRGKLAELNRYLFQEQGFSGNQDDYYDPRNSYINDVFDRRLGIPLSLGIIQIEVARRLGIELEGVSFPGHFLVRMPMDGGLLVLDPYHQGRSIDADELKLRARPHLQGGEIDDQQLLEILAPAGARAILMRMLRNLKGLYLDRENWDKVVRCSDRLVKLDPSLAEERRDRGLMYMKLGHVSAARIDLNHYLSERPEASDVEEIRLALIESSSTRARIN